MSNDRLIKEFLVDIHNTIAEHADGFIDDLVNGQFALIYPPGIKLTEEQNNSIRSISLISEQQDALKIVVKDLCANLVLDMFAKLDGVADPSVIETQGVWPGLTVIEKTDENEGDFLHDQFLGEFWTYHESIT